MGYQHQVLLIMSTKSHSSYNWYNEIDNFTTANTFPFKMVVFEILSVKWLSCLPTLESGECKYLYFTLVEGSHQERCREDTTM